MVGAVGDRFRDIHRDRIMCEPVCHAGDWEGVRPWPRPLPGGRGPDGVDDRTPDDEVGRETKISPLMAGVLLLARAWKANHIASKVPKGLASVPLPFPRGPTSELGYCSFTAIRTTYNTVSVPGAKAPSVPVAAEKTTRNSQLKSRRGVPFVTPKVFNSL